jgi:ribosome maturation factor RimP
MGEEILMERIRACVVPLVESASLELIDMQCRRASRGMDLVLLVDRPEGGITVDECARLNRLAGDALEEADIMPGPYTLEVSSPGIDRRLSTEKDFLSRVGKRVRFHLSGPVEGKIEWDGIVRQVSAAAVEIDARAKRVSIPLDRIHTARQIVE